MWQLHLVCCICLSANKNELLEQLRAKHLLLHLYFWTQATEVSKGNLKTDNVTWNTTNAGLSYL